MKPLVLIPARLASTRLPNKPLADIHGLPMIVRVARRAAQAAVSGVMVACDAPAIAEACKRHGVNAVLTRSEHASGSDRLAEACEQLGVDGDAVVVNVQGDEPLMPPALVRQAAQLLAEDPEAHIATLAHGLHEAADFANPNVVKVVSDRRGYALYFSRAPIPWQREGSAAGAPRLPEGLAYRHIGLYAYRVGALAEFSGLPPAPLEDCEALEQLRALYHGFRIKLGTTDNPPPRGVDTEEDLALLAAQFAARR